MGEGGKIQIQKNKLNWWQRAINFDIDFRIILGAPTPLLAVLYARYMYRIA